MAESKRGVYIIFESVDGGGKSTHAKLLCDYLSSIGKECFLAKEPGGVPEAEKIRNIVLDKSNSLSPVSELFLFEAARSEIFRQGVIPALESGKIVISDRSFYSSEAHQGIVGGIDLELVRKMNFLASSGVKADLVFLIDVPVELALSKEVAPDRFAEKGIEYHKRAREAYLRIASENPEVFVILPYIENGIEQMQVEIRKIVREKLGAALGL